jgi:hypothetical protein
LIGFKRINKKGRGEERAEARYFWEKKEERKAPSYQRILRL